MNVSEWAGTNSAVAAEVLAQSERCLATYREDARRVEQDAAIESGTAEGGYGRKQLYELIQNGADALLGGTGRIHVMLSKSCLYVANQGKAISLEGVNAIMATHLGVKRGDEIGRFGLGLKSIVAISDRPQFISRTGSFEFDRQSAERAIARVVPDAPKFPMLRTAAPVDALALALEDEILRDLMSWASTVVRVPLKAGYDDLSEDVRNFPAEFLLFSPHAAELRLVDLFAGVDRTITVAGSAPGEVLLNDGIASKPARWYVASRQHNPSSAALSDAGERAHREAIKVWWAVPVDQRSALGSMWAFFPTEDRTTLSGIVNAPWKTGDDRRNLLGGAFNAEIVTEVLPALISSAWRHLLDPQDPASILDLLPARGKESRSWADDRLNEPVFRFLRNTPALPDTSGRLTSAAALKLHPDGLTEELLDAWMSLDPAPEGWVHHGVDKSRERRLKAARLIGDSDASRASVREWIEALSAAGSVAASATAILLIDAIVRAASPLAREARTARVVLLEDGILAPVLAGQVFVRSSPEDSGFNFIHPDLAALPAVREALARMGVKVLDRAGELRHLLSGKKPDDVNWMQAWVLIRQCPSAVARQVLEEELGGPAESTARVRTRATTFVPVGAAYLPGSVVSESAAGDAGVCFDLNFHRVEEQFLTEIGCVSHPYSRSDAPDEPWLIDYRDNLKRNYVDGVNGAKPQIDRLEVVGPLPPWPLQPFARLSDAGRLAVTKKVLEQSSGEPFRVRHMTNAEYAPRAYLNSVYMAVLRHGRFETSFGPLPAAYCLIPREDLPHDLLPVVEMSDKLLDVLQVAAEPRDLRPEAWIHLSKVAALWDDPARTFLFYAWMVWFAEAPSLIRAQVGKRVLEVPIADVAVVSSQETFSALVEQAMPVILVDDDEDAAKLQVEWGLEDGKRLLEQALVHQPSGEPEVLVDRFPRLRLFLDPERFDLQLQSCSSINLETATRDGMRSKPVTQALDGVAVLVTATAPEAVLRQVSSALQLELTPQHIHSVLDQIREQQVEDLIARIRNAADDGTRLAVVVGSERLRRSVPTAAIENIEDHLGRRLDDAELAGLVFSVHGVGALQYFRQVMEDQGLNPPRQWAGMSTARRFVADLGFAPEFAGFAADARPAVFAVDGPAVLSPLHDYQLMVTTGIKRLLRGHGSARGMVSLPTGAGKTRVAVQAIVEELRDKALQGPVVWIAQSDELCEQAVETWTYIWRAVGPSDRMTVGRLWGTNEISEVTDGFHLVVATPEKLDGRITDARYDWLRETTVVVVDEAHTSIAPSYTRVLEWLGRGRSRKERRPLLGLTATPFRGTSETETARLASRYDRNRLDAGAFIGDPYGELQKRRVLAKVNQRVLQGVDVQFNAVEAAEMRDLRRVPPSIEAQLGSDVERNRRIVASIVELPEDWTVLLFATSVENARVLAAMLSFEGVSAVAVSGDTDSRARKFYIDEFKAGRIRVITNYAVLTQGFDAPRVQAVYVTRPTFSPNIYQQMIGRGLRGPLNGGSEEVLIVNVEDNFKQFGDQLAFLDFEHLWNPDDES